MKQKKQKKFDRHWCYHLFLIIGLTAMSMQSIYAQNIVTTDGVVVDDSGKPLIGVSIFEKGRNNGTVTDLNGKFSLKIDTNATIVVSYIGFISQEISAGMLKNRKITMSENIRKLDEVVVVGYGKVNKKDLTGSVGQVKIDDMQKAPVSSFEDALAGRVAGVQVSSKDGQPGSSSQIVIRGNNSITQNNSPLYVIDGFPIEDPANNVLNPEEIESIDILKDASATAIYGARGANGVVVINTKRGKIGKSKITYNNWIGFGNNPKRIEVLSPYEFVKYQLELDPAIYTALYINESTGKTLDSYKDVKGLNWQNQIFRTATSQNHSLSVSGGDVTTKYSISGSILSQDGIVINSGYERYQGRVTIDTSIKPGLKVGINANYSRIKKYGQIASENTNTGSLNLMYSVWGYRPITGDPSKNELILTEPFDPDVSPMSDYRINPILSTKNTYNPVFNNTLSANAYLEYKFLKNFNLRITAGIVNSGIRYDIFNNSKTQAGSSLSAIGINGLNGSTQYNENNSLLNENTLTYEKIINKFHRLTILTGFTAQTLNFMNTGFSSILLPNESLGISGLDQGTAGSLTSTFSSSALMSALGRVNYSYKSRYLLTASIRSDGSSKFSPKNRWAYFPSVSLAWRLNEEPFLVKFKKLSNAKLRMSYGLTGNNRVSDFAYLSSLNISPTSGYSYGNTPLSGTIPTSMGNTNLKWETTAQDNIGIDLAFYNGRISFTADYYNKITSDLLLNATLASSMGFLNSYKNIGKVSNKGLEFSVSTVNIKTPSFTWGTSFNISFNKNKVLELAENQESMTTKVYWMGNYNGSNPYITLVGQPIAMFYGYVFDGVYQYSDFNKMSNGTYSLKTGITTNGLPAAKIKPGSIKLKDLNGDYTINAMDQTIIGNPNPLHFGGFSNNFKYKAIDLSIFFQWSYGNEVLNANRYYFEGGESLQVRSLNMFNTVSDRWTPENQTNKLYSATGTGVSGWYNSRVIEDGSYLRLKTVSLGFTFPSSITKRLKIENFRIYSSAQNLFTWTKYSGQDPEVSTRSSSALTPGFDWSSYPNVRTITIGMNLTF